jgi:predicted ATP-grasp superfamily ATP-dependent carboligase
MPPGERILICAISGRALAQSARAAGFVPVVLDRFGDDDTRVASRRGAVVAASRDVPFLARGLLRAAAELAPAPLPLLYGSGFDGSPRLLTRLSKGRELLGNPPGHLARVKEPFAFADLCDRLGIPHPDVTAELPGDSKGWLVKRRGGAGGGHVRPARGLPLAKGDYLQRHVEGRAVSALLLGDGRRSVVLAFSEQWQRPGRRQHFTGALFPANLPPTVARTLAGAAIAVAEAHELRGLCSADFLLVDGRFNLLEVNPRPGASLEAAELHLRAPLVALHVEAARGRLPATLPEPCAGAAATEIVWMDRDLTMPTGVAWPDWAGDRTPPGTELQAGHPVATVRAEAVDAPAARALLAQRAAALLAGLAKGRLSA